MSSKRGPLSKAEVFYISEHAKIGKDISEIASDLDRPVKAIDKCYTKAQKENAESLTVGGQFARHKGSVIMTENASTMSDSTRSKSAPSTVKNCVTKAKK